jgi:hypothetical protein
MRRSILAVLLFSLPVAGNAQSLPAERWDVTSTVVDLTVPGAPGFLLRMAKGKSRTERKCVAAGQMVAALLAPDPKARCRIDKQEVADGRYTQALTCPQKRGAPMQVNRAGTYNAGGFTGRAEMRGQTAKGAMHVVLDQRAARVAGKCG